jgi:hypothetical protein
MRRSYWLATLLLLAGLVAAGAWYGLAVPGRTHVGALPAASEEERDLAARLRRHVAVIASEPHNTAHPQALERSARYIEQVLAAAGLKVERQVYEADGKPVRNIFVTLDAPGGQPVRRTIVVGAHYDSWEDTPGANDNGSGAAAALELARLLGDHATPGTRLIVVLFVNEEPPYFQTPDMGSVRFADMLAARKEPVAAMLSLETIGFFSDEPGSQQYPPPLSSFFPSKADFISFVAMPGSRGLLHDVMREFRATTRFPTIGGVAPGFIPGIDWSDHWSFAQAGFQALMVTDTALFRYAHYHQPTDTPEKVDYDKLARITKGLERAVRALLAK